jgi:hypothetical protein
VLAADVFACLLRFLYYPEDGDRSSERSINVNQTTQRHISDDYTFEFKVSLFSTSISIQWGVGGIRSSKM